MSTAPTPGPRDSKPLQQQKPPQEPKPTSALIFDDPLDRKSADDTDRGWGERPPAADSAAADLRRFLDEKPPHHV